MIWVAFYLIVGIICFLFLSTAQPHDSGASFIFSVAWPVVLLVIVILSALAFLNKLTGDK